MKHVMHVDTNEVQKVSDEMAKFMTDGLTHRYISKGEYNERKFTESYKRLRKVTLPTPDPFHDYDKSAKVICRDHWVSKIVTEIYVNGDVIKHNRFIVVDKYAKLKERVQEVINELGTNEWSVIYNYFDRVLSDGVGKGMERAINQLTV